MALFEIERERERERIGTRSAIPTIVICRLRRTAFPFVGHRHRPSFGSGDATLCSRLPCGPQFRGNLLPLKVSLSHANNRFSVSPFSLLYAAVGGLWIAVASYLTADLSRSRKFFEKILIINRLSSFSSISISRYCLYSRF